MGEWPTCGRWGRTSDPGDMAAPMATGPQLESREPVAGRCGLSVCLPQRCPLVLLDCPLFSTPFLPALAPCMEQGLQSGFLPEVTLAFMGKSALCSKHYQRLELTPRTRGSYRDIGSRGMDTAPPWNSSFCCHRVGFGGLRSRGGSGTQPLASCSSMSSPPWRPLVFMSRTRLDSTQAESLPPARDGEGRRG